MNKQIQQITTILWDVDGTLLDFSYSQRYAITKCFYKIGKAITEEMIQRYSEINDSYWRQLELGEISKNTLQTGRFLTLFAEYGIEAVDVEAFSRDYQEALGSVYSYLDDSLTICKSLQGYYKQFIVTNGTASTQRNKLKCSGLSEVMEDLFISDEIGINKPDIGFFTACLEKIEEKEKSKIILVGDSLTSDIKGGVNAGILTCWYNPSKSCNDTSWKPDYEIQDLHQIYKVLHFVI